MKRITITIEEGLYDKLPKYGKSGVINLLIKQHFQKEGFDQLYEQMVKKLLQDKRMNDWIVATAQETRYS